LIRPLTHRSTRGSQRKRRARRRSAIILGLLVAIILVFVIARSTEDDGSSDEATTPDESTAVEGSTTSAVPVTPPIATGPQLAASDASGSRYTIAANPFTVQLSFTSLCWIEARRGGSTGDVLVADAFNAGDTPEFTESALWIRVGYPAAATITVNGVALPAVAGTDPYNIEITGGAASG
jgi:hypothetical protein